MRNKLTKFLTSECPPKGMRQFAKTWKYAACMLLAFILGIGQMWGDTFSAAEIATNPTGGTKKNHVTVHSPGITSTSSQQIWKDGSTAKKEDALVISADASNSDLQNRSGSYIEIIADEGYTLGTTINIRGGAKNSSAKIAPVVWWKETVSSTIDGGKFDLELPSNAVTSSSAADLVVTIPSGMKVVRIYRKVRLNKTEHTTFVTSNYDDIGGGSAAIVSIGATAVGLTPVCPSGLTISSKDNKIAFMEGDAIELTAALTAGNGSITYQWYKGSVAPANAISGATNAKYQVASCTTADAGDYFCVASKTSCDDAVNASAFAITVAADTKCFNMPAITSKPSNLASVTVTGGTLSDVSVNGKSVSMDGNGLKFGGNDSRLKVTLTGASIIEGTKITVAWKGASAGSAGVGLFNENLASQVISVSGGEAAGSVSHTFTAEEAANYADEFIINRNASGSGICINAITVEDCGPAIVKHTVTLNYNDGETPAGSLTVVDGNAAVKPADPTRGKYTFLGWFVGDTDNEYVWSTAVTDDITLKAHWQDPWTITFDSNGGSAVADITVKHNTLAEKPADPTWAGHDFNGWTEGGTPFDWTAAITADHALVADWIAEVAKYDVEYYDGDTKIGTEEQVRADQHPTAAGITTDKPLCTFVGWYTSSTLEGDPVALNTVTPVEGLKLYGKWNKSYATSSDMEAYAVSDGASLATLLENLTAAGYAYTNVNGIDNGHTHNYIYDGMKYKTNDGDLSFNVNAGKLVIVKTGNLPANALTMYINGVADPTVFVGANEAVETHVNNYFYSAVEALYRLDIQASKGTCAIKAVTITNPFTVSFDANGGDDVASLNGTPSVTLPLPTKGTESFLGWFDGETNVGMNGDKYTPTANITLVAHWEAVSTDARLSAITFSSAAGTLSPAFDPEVTNYTYTMPYGTAAVPTITGATSVSAKAQEPQIVSQASAWGETAVIRGVAESSDTKAYNITMVKAPKDGASIFKAELTSATTATYSGIYADADNSQIKLTDDGANGYKFGGTSNFIKMALDGGTFQTGDILHMSYQTNPQQGELAIYENTTKIVGTSFENHTLEFTAGADGLTELFIRRTSDNNFNGWVSVVEVTRVVNPMLTAITFAGEAGTINESLKTVTVTVPNATDLGSMTVVPTIVRNAPHATTPEAVITNEGAWVEGPNTYRIMDKDGDYTDYTITITRAALSDDATLSLLTVNGQAIALADGVFEYSFELPYGTSSAPTVVATPHHIAAVATVDPCTLSGATITVVPESGAGDQKVYTLTFTISPWKEIVIWDGSTMSAVATSPDATGLAWEAVGCTGIENWTYATDEPNGKVPAYCSDNDKTYTHVNGSGKNECNIFRTGGNTKNTRYFQIAVPAGYVAKFYVVYGSHSEGTELTMSIGTEASATATDGILSLTTDHRYLLSGGMSEVVGAGDYYLNATGSADFFEIRAYLRPGYGRKVSNNIGTLCVDHNVPAGGAIGATFYQLVGKEPTYGKLVFDEVTELVAGEPYIFESTTGSIALYYGETVAATPVEVNHMIGSYVDTKVTITEENKKSVMYISNNKLWDCSDYLDWTSQEQKLQVVANRAYIANYDAIGAPASASPAPGRRRITVGKDGQNATTDVDLLNAAEAPVKMIIDGKMYILRGEKMYDATGRLVK